MGIQAQPAFYEFGFSLLSPSAWNPPAEKFGLLPMIYGTIISSLIALLIAWPIGLASAIVLSEYFRLNRFDFLDELTYFMVHSASIQERRGFKLLSFKIRHLFPNLKVIWVDGGYDGQPLQLWVQRWFNWVVETIHSNQDPLEHRFSNQEKSLIERETEVWGVWEVWGE